MTQTINLKKGFEIKLQGEALRFKKDLTLSRTFAIKPKDFKGVIPKLEVKEGAEVKAGDSLFYSKANENMKFTAPVSGEVVEIKRGAKRVIEEIKILSDSTIKNKTFGKANPSELSREDVKGKMLESGCWAFVRQRPFSSIADPLDVPKSIFISGFDSAPLGVDYNFLVEEEADNFQTGVDALVKLTDGKVHLNVNKNHLNSDTYLDTEGVELTEFTGKHPVGNVGIQIHHIDPIEKGDVVWTINPFDVVILGRLFNEGIYNPEKYVAVAGSEANMRSYFKFKIGGNVQPLVKDNLVSDNVRVISGNPLTGKTIDQDGYLGFYDYSVTVLPEGNEYEFLGWLIPTYPRPSNSMTLPSYLMPNQEYKANTNPHGERRALVLYGEYEKVLPMDIFATHLINKCMAETIDIEAIEKLGIFELAPEDLALCEFVCTSKIPVQEILEDALVLIQEEG